MSEIYIVHVDSYVGAYKGGKCPMISYAPRDKWIDFVKTMIEDYPDNRLRCVHDEKIEERVRRQINYNKLLTSELKRVQCSR